MKRWLTGLLLLSLAALSVSTTVSANGTWQQGTPTPVAPAAGLTASGFIRVIQSDRAAGAVDIALNGNVSFPQVEFEKASDFQPIAPGLYTVEARSGESVIGKVDMVLASGVSANILVLAKPNAAGAKVVVFVTNRAPTKGKTRIEFVHAVPDTPKVDVLQEGKPVLTEITYSKPGNAPQNLTPSIYNFAFVATKTTTPKLLDVKGMGLKADTIYTIVVVRGQDGKVSTLTLTTTSSDESKVPATPAK